MSCRTVAKVINTHEHAQRAHKTDRESILDFVDGVDIRCRISQMNNRPVNHSRTRQK